jgi:hypothetical protein
LGEELAQLGDRIAALRLHPQIRQPTLREDRVDEIVAVPPFGQKVAAVVDIAATGSSLRMQRSRRRRSSIGRIECAEKRLLCISLVGALFGGVRVKLSERFGVSTADQGR